MEDSLEVYTQRENGPLKRWIACMARAGVRSPLAAITLATVIFSAWAAAPLLAAADNDFAERLVAAARKQTWIPVIYSPAYRKISYPMGDVPWYLGVCTDVIVRAYRQLDIDLQVLVHEARVGSGDTNIDHRRVPVLKRFFERKARSMPRTTDPDAYAPGDIVTYHVPDGRHSKTHIALVSDRKNASGVPLIIHNRGWGVREEDWLFENKITGHFRFAPQNKTAGK